MGKIVLRWKQPEPKSKKKKDRIVGYNIRILESWRKDKNGSWRDVVKNTYSTETTYEYEGGLYTIVPRSLVTPARFAI